MSDDAQRSRSQLEAILGGKIGGPRIVPGTKTIAGREFLYVGCRADLSATELGDQFHEVLAASTIVPADGSAALSENCTLTLPSGECFFGLSYKGDLQGWRDKAKAGAQSLGLKAATIEGDTLAIDDGRHVLLTECAVRFF